MVSKGLALILSCIIKPFTMTVQNQSSRCVLKNKLNLGQNTKRLFQVLTKLPSTITETKLGYYHHRWNVRAAPLVALRS